MAIPEPSSPAQQPKLKHKKTSDIIFQTRPQGYRNSLFSKQFSLSDVLNNLRNENKKIKEESSETSDDSSSKSVESYEPTENSEQREASLYLDKFLLEDQQNVQGEAVESAE